LVATFRRNAGDGRPDGLAESPRPTSAGEIRGEDVAFGAFLVGEIGASGLLELRQRIVALLDQPANDVELVGLRQFGGGLGAL